MKTMLCSKVKIDINLSHNTCCNRQCSLLLVNVSLFLPVHFVRDLHGCVNIPGVQNEDGGATRIFTWIYKMCQ